MTQSPSERKIRLSGYGVELAVKKTEYKAVDDSKVKDECRRKGTGKQMKLMRMKWKDSYLEN